MSLIFLLFLCFFDFIFATQLSDYENPSQIRQQQLISKTNNRLLLTPQKVIVKQNLRGINLLHDVIGGLKASQVTELSNLSRIKLLRKKHAVTGGLKATRSSKRSSQNIDRTAKPTNRNSSNYFNYETSTVQKPFDDAVFDKWAQEVNQTIVKQKLENQRFENEKAKLQKDFSEILKQQVKCSHDPHVTIDLFDYVEKLTLIEEVQQEPGISELGSYLPFVPEIDDPSYDQIIQMERFANGKPHIPRPTSIADRTNTISRKELHFGESVSKKIVSKKELMFDHPVPHSDVITQSHFKARVIVDSCHPVTLRAVLASSKGVVLASSKEINMGVTDNVANVDMHVNYGAYILNYIQSLPLEKLHFVVVLANNEGKDFVCFRGKREYSLELNHKELAKISSNKQSDKAKMNDKRGDKVGLLWTLWDRFASNPVGRWLTNWKKNK